MLSGYWSSKQKWTLASVVRSDDAAGRNLSKTFEFVFPEFNAEQAESQRFWFGGAEWYFTTEKYGDDDYLGVFLSLAQDQPGFSMKLKSYKFVVVDQEDETYNMEKSSVPEIFSYSQGWGFQKFVKLSELKRADRSYLRTNRAVFRLELTHATARYDHIVDISSLKSGSTGKFSYDSIDWAVRVGTESDGSISAFVSKSVTTPAAHYTGQLKIILINHKDEQESVKSKLGVCMWSANKPQHGQALLKVSDLKTKRDFIRNLTSPTPPASPAGKPPRSPSHTPQSSTSSATSSSTSTPPQIVVRFEMKHVMSLQDIPIPNLSPSALAGSSLSFNFQSLSWILTCKKEGSSLALHLHLQNPSDHKSYHTAFSLTAVGTNDDPSSNITKQLGNVTFYKYATQMGFAQFASLEELSRVRAITNNTLLIRVGFHKMDLATNYLDATVYKGGAAAVKLAKDEIEKFRKYYYAARAELKLVKEELEKATKSAQKLESKQGKFQLELEPLQMALQAKTEAAETLLTDLEAERTRTNALKHEVDKNRESLGFMSMLWLENVKHVSKLSAKRVPSPPAYHSAPQGTDANGVSAPVKYEPNGIPNGQAGADANTQLILDISGEPSSLASEHSAMATLDILNTLKQIVEETGQISSKQLRKEYKQKTGTSLRETLRRAHLGTPLAFLEAHMNVFTFEEPTISLKSTERHVEARITKDDLTSMAIKSAPSADAVAFLQEAYEFVTKFLPQVLPLPIVNVYLAGPAGKGISLAGSSTVDVVVFIDKVPDHGHAAWLPPILTQLRKVIKIKLPNASDVGTSEHCVHFSFEGATINIYPTSQWQKSSNGESTMFETMLKYPSGWYDAATAPQQVEFLKSQTEAVKSIIRIVQTWNQSFDHKQLSASDSSVGEEDNTYGPAPNYLIELLAIYACTPKTSGALFDPMSALTRFFEVAADIDTQRIYWERFYKINIVPSSIFMEQPLVLDPTNPTNNLARQVDLPTLKKRAKMVLDSGLTALLPLFSQE